MNTQPRIIITGHIGTIPDVHMALQNRGCVVIDTPCIKTTDGASPTELTAFLREAEVLGEHARVVVTSVQGAERIIPVLVEQWDTSEFPTRILVMGDHAAQVFADHNISVIRTAGNHATEVITEIANIRLRPLTVFLPGAATLAGDWKHGLTENGVTLQHCSVYHTTANTAGIEQFRTALSEPTDIVVFLSPSAVHAVVGKLGTSWTDHVKLLACLGSTTAVAARHSGLVPSLVPNHPTQEALAAELLAALEEPNDDEEQVV